MLEYVIWGVPPHKEKEELLLSEFKGKAITDLKTAEIVVKLLESQIGCTQCRIQTVDLSDFGFSNLTKLIKKL